ncbi:ABC transporter ATP-binding protein [Streptomyces blattellae]|uniref:ABC transporter ATP-binding protein n=1 Tax=Streptomyces blattellae TaxID=2569855 RepID=UPI0012B72639|nr:ABC transporter ATP-binding protein [Streptomyces blattellae]
MSDSSTLRPTESAPQEDGAPDAHVAPQQASPALLEVRDLHTHFKTPRGILRAVDGVSFTLEQGATLGIAGESGSGKSALVRSIMDLTAANAIRPTGHVIFDGRDMTEMPRWEARHFWGPQIAMVFQDPMTSLNPVKRVGAQLTESMRHHLGLSRRDARSRAIDLLHQVRIPEPKRRLDQYPHELSGGMRQRVTIAIALACEPRLLIADEPTTALDVTVQKQILELLASLQEAHHMAMILITHDLGVIAGYTDRTAVMYAGQVVEEASTTTLFDEVRHPYTNALLASIPRVEEASHVRLEAISGRPPDMTAPPAACRFAARCRLAQDKCLTDAPTLVQDGSEGHRFRCFYPVGTGDGVNALKKNLERGSSAAGLPLKSKVTS